MTQLLPPPLVSAYLYLANVCNLHCQHCWIQPRFLGEDRLQSESFLNLTSLEKFIAQAKPLGLNHVKLTGGEPLIHPEIKQIIKTIKEHKLSLSIETNGLLLDDELADLLTHNAPFPFVSISLDGAVAKTHDEIRRVPGCFEKSVSTIHKLTSKGLFPQIIFTINKKNQHELPDLILWASQNKCSSFKVNVLQKIGRGKSFGVRYGLTIGETLSQYHELESWRLLQDIKIPITFDLPVAFLTLDGLVDNTVGRCGILTMLGLLSDGTLSLCGIGELVPELKLGNIACDKLSDIWQNNPILQEIRKKIPGHFRGVCQNCIHKDYCLGKCIAHNYFDSHQLDAPFYFCQQAFDMGIFPVSRLIDPPV